MTDNGRSRRLKQTFITVIAIAGWTSCESAPKTLSEQRVESVAVPSSAPTLIPGSEPSPVLEITPHTAKSLSGTEFVDQSHFLKIELSKSSIIDGTPELITVHGSGPIAAISGEYEGENIPFYPLSKQGKGVFETVLGIPFNHKPGMTTLRINYSIPDGTSRALTVPVQIVEGDYPSERLKVAERKVNPKKRDMIRIRKELSEIADVYRRVTPIKYWTGPFQMPIQSAITSRFGTKRVYNGEMKNFHQGLDLRAGIGTPIHAASGGVIVLAKNLFFTGNSILLDHGYGIFTLYAHMSKLNVKTGQVVQGGELLGLSGNTGRVSGPHLHWGAIIHHAKVDPKELTQVMR